MTVGLQLYLQIYKKDGNGRTSVRSNSHRDKRCQSFLIYLIQSKTSTYGEKGQPSIHLNNEEKSEVRSRRGNSDRAVPTVDRKNFFGEMFDDSKGQSAD